MLLHGKEFALLVGLSILLVAVFPLAAGPFTVTHGPATALRALAFAILLFAAIAILSSILFLYHAPYRCLTATSILVADTSPGLTPPLRC